MPVDERGRQHHRRTRLLLNEPRACQRTLAGKDHQGWQGREALAVTRGLWSVPRRMKGDRVAIRITGNEEAAEGTVSKRTEDRAAPLDDQVVQRVSVIARDPEHHARTERPRVGKRTERLSQRQRDRRGLENDRARRTLRRGFETEDLHVELTGCGEAAHLQGNEVGADWRCHASSYRIISVT